MSGSLTVKDLSENHGLTISSKLLYTVNQRVGNILAAKDQKWTYSIDTGGEQVSTIGISRDGTTSPIRKEGHKETMVGTISLYNQEGNRLHTIYMGCCPQSKKVTFNSIFGEEIRTIREKYPQAQRVSIADGAKDNWTFLKVHSDIQIVDFWHATEYLAAYAKVVYSQEKERKKWLKNACHCLKHEQNAAEDILIEIKEYATKHKIEDKENPVKKAMTYFTNQMPRMQYWKYQQQGLPIGSGVVEAACKTLVKQRVSVSGAKWDRTGLDNILLARGLILSDGRWQQFWENLDREGI